MIIVQPNCSASWRNNQLVLIAISIPSLTFAIGFALLGAWPILPFAGLELLALGSALYYVNWKLQYRHVITLSDENVCIDKGFYMPRQSWKFPRQGTGLAIIPEQHPWDGPELSLQRTAGTGSGGFIDAGVACAASRTSVFDLAVGAGWDRGFPEWTVNVGWTRLFDRE